MCKFVQCYNILICTHTIEFHGCLDTILALCCAFFLAGVVDIIFQVEQFGQKPKGSYLKLTIILRLGLQHQLVQGIDQCT